MIFRRWIHCTVFFKRWFVLLHILFLAPMLATCKKSTTSIEVILKSSDLKANNTTGTALTNALELDDDIELLNITGLADAVLFPLEEHADCGYVVFDANEQGGPVGILGRTYEPFDLAIPPIWTHDMGDLQCDGGTANKIHVLAPYLDLHLRVANDELEFRVALGNFAPYLKGDVLIRKPSDGVDDFSWSDGTMLVDESKERPENTIQLASVVNWPTHINRAGQDVILSNLVIQTVDKEGISTDVVLSKFVTNIDIDIKLNNSGITIEEGDSLAAMVNTFRMNALNSNATGSLTALVTTTIAESQETTSE